jgi:hypothetical protein
MTTEEQKKKRARKRALLIKAMSASGMGAEQAQAAADAYLAEEEEEANGVPMDAAPLTKGVKLQPMPTEASEVALRKAIAHSDVLADRLDQILGLYDQRMVALASRQDQIADAVGGVLERLEKALGAPAPRQFQTTAPAPGTKGPQGPSVGERLSVVARRSDLTKAQRGALNEAAALVGLQPDNHISALLDAAGL